MARVASDALVIFGATGDLAFKKIFPALQAMVKRGRLDVPVVTVGRDPEDASVPMSRCILGAPGGPVDLHRYPIRKGSRIDQVQRYVRARIGE